MDATFSISVSTETTLLPSVANVLYADGIAELLKTYPNQPFTDILISIAIYGAYIGFEGRPFGHIQHLNHSSALAHPEIIMESI